MRRILPVLLLLFVPASAGAQSASDPFMTSSRQLYEAGKRFVVTTAEQMPAEDFAYRPVATVRTLGQILGHLADVHFIACSIALGEENPNPSSYGNLVTYMRMRDRVPPSSQPAQ